MGEGKFLYRPGKGVIADHFADGARKSFGDPVDYINHVGSCLLPRFWVETAQCSNPDELSADTNRHGVYLNGSNIAEVHGQISAGNLSFWNCYSKEAGIPVSEPARLMQHWLKSNNRTRYLFFRHPEEVLAQQYIGEGGGCGDYVCAMTDILRALDIPTKIVYFLKHGGKPDEIRQFAESGEGDGIGHFMGACLVGKEWKLYDFKWQWNPNYADFYWGMEKGLNPKTLVHRDRQENRYVPVTNDGIFTPDEPLSSDNFGLVQVSDIFELKKSHFAKNFISNMD